MVLETNQAVRVSEMKRSIGQIPSWHVTSNARVKSGKSHVAPGPDGYLLATVSFAVQELEEFVYMWRGMLDQTEVGGEVWINYHAANDDGLLVDSLYTVLSVIG